MRGGEIWREYAEILKNNPDPFCGVKLDFYEANRQHLELKPGDTPKVAVVVAAHNEQAFLPRTLAGLNQAALSLKEAGVTSRVIVVDNASTDQTEKIANLFGVDVVFEPEKGIGKARQKGLEATQESEGIIMTTDSDVLVGKDWMNKYYELLTGMGGAVMAYGRTFEEFDLEPSARLKMYKYLVSLGKVGVYSLRGKMTTSFTPLSNNMAFRREVALELGGYNAELNANEDGDLWERVSSKYPGGIVFDPNIAVTHSNRRTLNEGMLRSYLRIGRNELKRFFTRRSIKGNFDGYSRDYRI